MLEVIKFLMYDVVVQLYRKFNKWEEDVFVFLLFLFVCDLCEFLCDLFVNYLNRIGDIGGLEQVMFCFILNLNDVFFVFDFYY